MEFFWPSRAHIKQNAHVAVKPALVCLGAVLLGVISPVFPALGEDLPLPDATPAVSPVPETSPGPEVLPEIEARTYPASVLRKSKNGKVLMFEGSKDWIPAVGRILLLKRGDTNVVALRVLKNYPAQGNFAAKVVRNYDQKPQIALRDTFTVIEKIADIVPIPPTPQDKADLSELEKSLLPPPGAEPGAEPSGAPGLEPEPALPELEPEVKPSPGPNGKADQGPIEDAPEENIGTEDEGLLGISTDEIPSIDPNVQSLSLSFGFMENNTSYFVGGGLRYGLTLKQFPFFRRPGLRDAVALEVSGFYYQILNYETTNGDSYTVFPVIGTLRYDLQFSDTFGIFLYGGLLRNFVTPTSDASTQATADRLAHVDESNSAPFGMVPVGGLGMLFRIGPQWDARFELGTDIIGLGIMLRF